jgi:thermostable 8-oxoguanine DNA glycosylase
VAVVGSSLKYKITVELSDTERSDLMQAIEAHPLEYEQGHWRQMTEDEVKESVVWCIASSQTKWDSVKKLYKLTKGQRVWEKSMHEIQRLLRQCGIRFYKKKAKWIASLAGKNVKKAVQGLAALEGGGLGASRKARRLLKDECDLEGLGDKQISHLLTKHLFFTPDLVPIDSRWSNFMRAEGLFQQYDNPSYVILEDLVIAIASQLGVKPADLDQAVWGTEE